jgi:hypothetical protein
MTYELAKASTFVLFGDPNRKHSELRFEKKQLISALQQLLLSYLSYSI